jgi:hypothetical protein
MPIIKFITKKCNKCVRGKCVCKKNTIPTNLNKKKIRINTYGLKYLEGLPSFYITQL